MAYFTTFEAYAITENRDQAIYEFQDFVKNAALDQQEDFFMFRMYKYAHLYYANCFYYPEAIECYEAMLRDKELKDPYVFAIYSYTQGRILFEDHQHDKSIAMFKKCSKIKYEHGEKYLWRPAMSYLYLQKYEKAMKSFQYFWTRRTSKLFNGGEVTMAFLGQGYCATKLKQHNEAEKYFKQAEKTKSESSA